MRDAGCSQDLADEHAVGITQDGELAAGHCSYAAHCLQEPQAPKAVSDATLRVHLISA